MAKWKKLIGWWNSGRFGLDPWIDGKMIQIDGMIKYSPLDIYHTLSVVESDASRLPEHTVLN